MSELSENNKRIAKNTLLLYIRMFFIMIITLFTSRVVLKTLGIENYGIYNVIAGIIAMMGVLNSAMSASIQRYLTYELGKGNIIQLKKIFSTCLLIYLLLSGIFFILAETIGLWFLNTQLVIPIDRISAANWVYQFSIIACINSLLSNPYNASIIAHEKMNVYAYVSIIEVLLKLAIVYLLLVIPYDRLSVYGLLICISQITVTVIYRIYCIKNFEECHFHFYKEKKLFKQLLSYSGWNLFGSVSTLIKTQGLNILLNLFFTPSVNAARGIAVQINAAITQFFTNFYTAVRPQITKYYAKGELQNMFTLVFRSSKFSYYLILLISLPIIIETPYIIKLWLGQLPDYVVIFTRLIIIISAIDSMSSPLMTTAHATGNIAFYQSAIGLVSILNLPISYIALKIGGQPEIVFYISLIISFISLFIRLIIIKKLIQSFPVTKYITNILLIIILVTILSSVLPIILYIKLSENFINFILVSIVSLFTTGISIYYIGLCKTEKEFIKQTIQGKFKNNHK